MIPDELDGHPIMAAAYNPFLGLYQDYTVALSQGHPYLATIDGVLFGEADQKLICYPKCLDATTYEIPQGIQEIGGAAFADCSILTSVTIPESVTSIGWGAFEGSSRLTLTVIAGSYAEGYCRENGLPYSAVDPDLTDAPTDWLTGTP